MSGADRHGRAAGVDGDRRKRPSPGYRARTARRFRQFAELAIDSLPGQLHEQLNDAELVIDEVPPGETVLLATFKTKARPPLLVVYRRPVEARAGSRNDLEDVLRVAIGQAVARAVGMDDEDLDDLFDDDE